jgi:hypothetical protein
VLRWYCLFGNGVGVVLLFFHAFYIVNVECSIKKNDAGLQITPCCSTVVQVGAPYVLPLCAHDDLTFAVSVLLSLESHV